MYSVNLKRLFQVSHENLIAQTFERALSCFESVFSLYFTQTDHWLLAQQKSIALTADQSLQKFCFTDFCWILRMFERKTCGLNVVNNYNLEKFINSSVRVMLNKISGARFACHIAVFSIFRSYLCSWITFYQWSTASKKKFQF